jgi:hypothetical protein
MTDTFWKLSAGAFVISMIALGVAPKAGVTAAEVQLSPACKVAKTYLERVQARDVDGIRNLFAQNTNYTGPDGSSLSDPDQIAVGYKRGLENKDASGWEFRIVNLLPFNGGVGCLMEFATAFDKPGEFSLSAVDHFEVDSNGKISRFLPYFASNHVQRVVAHIEKNIKK